MSSEDPIHIRRLVTDSLDARVRFAAGSSSTSVTVFTNTSGESGTWTTIANEGATSFALFPSTAVGAALYVGGADVMTSVQFAVDTALASAAESARLSFEYWDGGSWSPVPTMMTNANAPNESYANAILSEAIDQQIRFGVLTSSGRTTRAVNGSDVLYWIRIIIITLPITVIPTATSIQGRPAHFSVNSIGEVERFGGTIRRVPWDVNTAKPANSSPANQDGYISDTVNVGRTENRFNVGIVDRTGLNFFVPAGMDTSKGIRVRIDWFSTSAGGGTVRWKFRFATSNVGDDVFPSAGAAPPVGPNQVEVTVDQVVPGAANTQMSVIGYIPTTAANGRPPMGTGDADLAWLTVERTGSDAADTYPGNVSIVNLTATYIEVFAGDCYIKF